MAQKKRKSQKRVSRDRTVTTKAEATSVSDEISHAHSELHEILGLLKAQTETDFSEYKLTTLSRRILRQMKIHKIGNLPEYTRFLKSNPQAVKELSNEVFIHVTDFFRDPEAYKALATTVFPALLKRRAKGAPLRIWVAGCATGEEAYSIAILLAEFLEKKSANVSFQIFATDISQRAIEKARVGIYDEAELSGVSAARLERYFEKVRGAYKVVRSLRDCCVFSRHDLTRNPPFAKMDLISCRNVLIYFSAELQKQIFPVFHYALNDNGYLWLGRSESPGTLSKLFSLVDTSNKIYEKVAGPTPQKFRFPSARVNDKIDTPKKPSLHTHSPDARQKEIDRIMLSRYAPPGAVLNSELDVMQVRGHTAPFLELPAGPLTHNIFKLVRPELLPSLRFLIQEVRRSQSSARKDGLSYNAENGQKKISIEVVAINPGANETDRQYLVFFEEPKREKKKTAVATASDKKPSRDPKTKEDVYIADLLKELDSLRDYQQSLSEGYEVTQEELTTSNEELQSTLEEFQSTNEELETAKEELQSANEELTTLNDELQARNQDLISLNAKLTESEERFRLMVEGVKDYAIFMLDPEGRVKTWNEGARRLKGYEADQIIGKHLSVFYSEEDKKRDRPAFELERAIQLGRVEDEGWRIRKDGSKFWANVIITKMENDKGELIGFSKITRDLTERKAAEDKLRLSELRTRLMTETVKDYAIFMLDPEGRVASWNEGAKRLKQYEANEIIGQHFSKFYPQVDLDNRKPQKELEIALANGRVEDEGWRVRKDGSLFWANVVITKVTDQDGKLLGFTKVTRDLTERMRAEEALRRMNETLEARVKERTHELRAALKVREDFLSIASHELKTPLTSLRLQLQMALMRFEKLSPQQISDALEMSLKQTEALVMLVDDLLDVSRAQTGRFTLACEDLDLSELTRDVLRRFSGQLHAAGISLECHLEDSLNGHWDKQRLEQVITNLVSNAIKYAPGKPLTISTERRGEKVVLTVRDQGPGIDPTHQMKIFDRFERANQSKNSGGLGLGLFIVREILEAHGGSISVRSTLGEGSTFIVELPLRSCIEAEDE